MKKTMTKQEFDKIIQAHDFTDDAYKALSKAGISFDIYTDSDGQIIKPGDECEFWDINNTKRFTSIFIGFYQGYEYPFVGNDGWYKNCRKITTEVWKPVPYGDINFGMTNENAFSFTYDTEKWAKVRINNGKLEGVRK